MQRVGIITTHRANNFGAVLQAYSLVSACQELGVDAEIIDWRCPHYEWQYHKAIRFTRNPFAMLRHFLWFVVKESKSRKLFSKFRNNLPLSKPINNRRKLQAVGVLYDKYIVGSDQVWNPLNSALKHEKFDRAYILDFVKGRSKNAYAASIGVKSIEPESVRNEFLNAWKEFDLITMREYEGAEYVSNLLGENVDAVLDPVLLHTKDWWQKLVPAESIKADPFIFEYNVRGVEYLDEFAQKIANNENAIVVNPLIPSFSFKWEKKVEEMGPAEFVSHIAQAKCVVTSSFHAAAFSVIFGKKLYLIQRKKSKDPNSRFSSLFKFAEVSETIVEESDRYYVSRIDCDKANQESLSQVRSKSMEFLRKMCLG